MIAHNRQLKKIIDQIKTQATHATTSNELLAAVMLAKNFSGDFKFKNNRYYLVSALAFPILACLWLTYPPLNQWQTSQIITISALVLLGIVPLAIAFYRRSTINSLSEYIFSKDALLDNQIKITSINSPFIQSLAIRFAEFERGNYSREFKQAWQLNAKEKGFNELIYLYQFHYVNQRTVTRTTRDAKGNVSVRTETVYDHFDRFGFIVQPEDLKNNVKNFHIASNGVIRNKVDYNAASILFSKTFNIGAESDLVAAKFLKPTVVLAIEELAKVFGQINLEFDATGLLCISFNNSNVVDIDCNVSLENPDLFYKKIAGHTELPLLNTLINFTTELIRQTDNNFN